ncbi:hypothetical protein ACQKTA_11430 (plasmid) [Enterococcus sp. 22-H-5-01]|uniref:hypothetical protein n=1 Tax=Enterococcus sp. 22-H-5-01 TaxID=3418555 RepID=UPI003D060D8F
MKKNSLGKKVVICLVTCSFFTQFYFPLSTFAETTSSTSSIVDADLTDHIEIPNRTIHLNVGDVFEPQNYATAYRGDQEISYGESNGGQFTAIVNEVDTTKEGTYNVVHRLHNPSGSSVDESMTVIVDSSDRIEVPNRTIHLNVGDVFEPQNYATAYRGDQEIPYGDTNNGGEFIAIVNEVDTTKEGTYNVVYRLHNPSGSSVDESMTVIVDSSDRIEVPNRTIHLNVGDVFEPQNYATAYRGDQEIPYGDTNNGGEFIAIVNEVDTTKEGTYNVVYRLHNPYQ